MTVELLCPYCRTVLASYGETTKFHQELLIRDSDAIPSTPSEVDGKAAMSFAAVGQCEACKRPYWFVEYLVFPGSEDQLIDHLAIGEDPTSCMVIDCREFDVPWIYQALQLPAGSVDSHMIGPFEIPEGTSPFTGNGVAACGPSLHSGFWAAAAGQACAAWPMVTAIARASDVAAYGRHLA